MGHYDSCYEADEERRTKKRIEQLTKDIHLEMKGMSLDELEVLAVLSENVKIVRGLSDMIWELQKNRRFA